MSTPPPPHDILATELVRVLTQPQFAPYVALPGRGIWEASPQLQAKGIRYEMEYLARLGSDGFPMKRELHGNWVQIITSMLIPALAQTVEACVIQALTGTKDSHSIVHFFQQEMDEFLMHAKEHGFVVDLTSFAGQVMNGSKLKMGWKMLVHVDVVSCNDLAQHWRNNGQASGNCRWPVFNTRISKDTVGHPEFDLTSETYLSVVSERQKKYDKVKLHKETVLMKTYDKEVENLMQRKVSGVLSFVLVTIMLF